jgi:hypothetical protein
MVEYDGGEGGRGYEKGTRKGSGTFKGSLPAPFPVHPLDGDIITDLSHPFEWYPLDVGYYPPNLDDFTFLLLGSDNISDTVQEFNVTGLSTSLAGEIDDGHYYWTVRPIKGNATTSWMKPQSFTLDRKAPLIQTGPGSAWLPSSNPVTSVIYYDDLTGIDPASVMVRFGPSGGSFGEWLPAPIMDLGEGIFQVEVQLPSVEGNYSFHAKASDMAGNGPILAGPYSIGVDGTAPLITDLAPEGWTGKSFTLSFRSKDPLSGLTGNFSCSLEGPGGSRVFDIEVVELEDGNFRMENQMKLKEGSYTILLSTTDLVGNVGYSGITELLVDDSSPVIAAFSPPDGSILRNDQLSPSILVVDSSSGLLSIDYHLEGPSGVFESIYEGSIDSINVASGYSFIEGNYTWHANITDLVGNWLNAGPFHFTVDNTPPALETEWLDIEGDHLFFTASDNFSGLAEFETRCEVPGMEGWIEVWKETINLVSLYPETLYQADIAGSFPDPVCYISVRGTDQAGNTGEWSSKMRIDHTSGMQIKTRLPNIARADSIIDLEIDAPLGMDISSLSIRLTPETGSPSVIDPASIDILGNSTPIPGSNLLVTSMVAASFHIPFSEGSFDVLLSFNDPLPLPKKWSSAPRSLTVDGESPIVIIESEPYYTEVPARVLLNVSDEISSMFNIEISVGGGDFLSLDSPGAPSLIGSENGKFQILINLSYGSRTGIEVRISDEAGNTAESSFSTRATRPPSSGIIRAFPDAVMTGKDYQISADCQDPDGDPLSYKWYIDGIHAGTGKVLSFSLSDGTHKITLNCSDGDLFAEEVLVIVAETEKVEEEAHEDDKGSSSLFWVILIILMVLVLVMITAGLILIRNRKENSAGKEELPEREDEKVRKGRTGEDVQIGRALSTAGEESIRCDICLRFLSDRSRKESCRCGAVFHRSCASGEGECPECGREIMLETGG